MPVDVPRQDVGRAPIVGSNFILCLFVGLLLCHHSSRTGTDSDDGAREGQHRDAHVRGAGDPSGTQSADGGARAAGTCNT